MQRRLFLKGSLFGGFIAGLARSSTASPTSALSPPPPEPLADLSNFPEDRLVFPTGVPDLDGAIGGGLHAGGLYLAMMCPQKNRSSFADRIFHFGPTGSTIFRLKKGQEMAAIRDPEIRGYIPKNGLLVVDSLTAIEKDYDKTVRLLAIIAREKNTAILATMNTGYPWHDTNEGYLRGESIAMRLVSAGVWHVSHNQIYICKDRYGTGRGRQIPL